MSVAAAVVIGEVPSFELEGDCVIIDSARDPELIAAVRAIPGRRWLAGRARWSVPIASVEAATVVLGLATRFSARCAEGFADALGAVAATGAGALGARQALEIRSEDAAVALVPSGRVREVPGMVDPPGKAFEPAQWAGVEYLLDWHTGCLVFDAPGVAKTAQSLAALAVLGRRRIVWICPATVKSKIAEEVRGRFPTWQAVVVDGRAEGRFVAATAALEAGRTAVVVLNYELLAAHAAAIGRFEPDALVLDESHRLANAKTAYAKVLAGEPARRRGRGLQAARPGLAAEVRARGGSVLLLSGTPMPNGPWDLTCQLEIAGRLGELGGKTAFSQRFCGERRQMIAGRVVIGHSLAAARAHFGELNVLLRQHGMLRRRLGDVCPELRLAPAELVEVDLDPDLMAEYARAEAEIVEYLAQKAAEEAARDGRDVPRAVRLARLRAAMARDGIELAVLRRLLGGAKVPGAIAWAKEWLATSASGALAAFDGEDAPGKLVVFAHHVEVIERLVAGLGGVAIRGGDPRAARDAARAAFQSDPEVRVIVCSLKAAGEGIELTAASSCLFVELDWVPATHVQAVGRLYRRGQRQPVRQVYAYAPHTCDALLRRVLDQKGQAADQVIDGTGQGEAPGGLATELVAALVARGAGGERPW